MVVLGEGETLRLETGAGLIPVTIDDGNPRRYTMTQVQPVFREREHELGEIASWMGLRADDVLRAEYVSTGIFWLVAQVASFEAMLRVRPDLHALGEHNVSIFCIGAASPEASIRVRTFAPGGGVPEDPVTGSSNGCIAAFIRKYALLPSEGNSIYYISEQGIEMGQPGRVYVSVSGTNGAMVVKVGGYAVTVLRGELLLPD
jgi:PhzF family phenazine biosynthesis protein